MVALTRGFVPTASGLPVQAHASIGEVGRTDLVIIPSVMVAGGEWVKGRYPEIVRWLRAMQGNGATLCSACSGLLLLAETDLLAGKEGLRADLPAQLPGCPATPGGDAGHGRERQELVMSGAAMAWHDLVLYLIDRYVGAASAQSIARFFAMRWHDDGQSPYIGFAPSTAMRPWQMRKPGWSAIFSVANPVVS